MISVTVSEVRTQLLSNGTAFRIELSKDGQNWEVIAAPNDQQKDNRRSIKTNTAISGRFLRITFTDTDSRTAALNEVEVYGRPVN